MLDLSVSTFGMLLLILIAPRRVSAQALGDSVLVYQNKDMWPHDAPLPSFGRAIGSSATELFIGVDEWSSSFISAGILYAIYKRKIMITFCSFRRRIPIRSGNRWQMDVCKYASRLSRSVSIFRRFS